MGCKDKDFLSPEAYQQTALKLIITIAGAKLDMYLAKKSNTPMETFSRSLVMQRYHHSLSMRENLSYRWRLYKVGFCEPSHRLARIVTL